MINNFKKNIIQGALYGNLSGDLLSFREMFDAVEAKRESLVYKVEKFNDEESQPIQTFWRYNEGGYHDYQIKRDRTYRYRLSSYCLIYGVETKIENFKDGRGSVELTMVSTPSYKYAVVEFDEDRNVRSLEEKPENPKSNFAVPGVYFYDNSVVEIAEKLEPSERGEYEITDVNKEYLKRGKLKVSVLERGNAWLDTGTIDSLMKAGQFVQTIESRQGLKIGCIEEVAYIMNYIDTDQLLELSNELDKSGYGTYLKSLL